MIRDKENQILKKQSFALYMQIKEHYATERPKTKHPGSKKKKVKK